jgi:hypothetical protein
VKWWEEGRGRGMAGRTNKIGGKISNGKVSKGDGGAKVCVGNLRLAF